MRDRLLLEHILEAIENIEEYVAGGRADFFGDKRTQDAVLRNLHTMAGPRRASPLRRRQDTPMSTGRTLRRSGTWSSTTISRWTSPLFGTSWIGTSHH